MKNTWKMLAVTLVCLLGAREAKAGTVMGTGGALESTQWMNLGQLIATVQTLSDQLTLIKRMAAQFQYWDWGQTSQELAALDRLVRQSGALAYSAGNLESQFSAQYPGYSTYQSGRGLGAGGMQQKYQDWSNETNRSVLGALRVAGLQASDFATEQSTMSKLASMSESAEGQTQVLQASNQIMMAMVGQMQKLRQLEMTSMQMHGDFLAQQVDREAAQRSEMQKRWAEPNISTTDGKRY